MPQPEGDTLVHVWILRDVVHTLDLTPHLVQEGHPVAAGALAQHQAVPHQLAQHLGRVLVVAQRGPATASRVGQDLRFRVWGCAGGPPGPACAAPWTCPGFVAQRCPAPAGSMVQDLRYRVLPQAVHDQLAQHLGRVLVVAQRGPAPAGSMGQDLGYRGLPQAVHDQRAQHSRRILVVALAPPAARLKKRACARN